MNSVSFTLSRSVCVLKFCIMNYLYKIIIIITQIHKIELLKCVMDSYNWCSFTNVNVTSTTKFFTPTYDYPYVVEKVRFYDSHMEILTDELCTSFYNLRELEIWNVNLRKIEPGALNKCTRLQWISFWSNRLRELDSNIFQHNHHLESLSFQRNEFKHLNHDIFMGLSKLRQLSLSDNYLRTFPVFEMTFLEALETLNLDTNELMDLDVQEVLYKFPNLRLIYINDNPFMCDRLRAILGTFRRNGVRVMRYSDQHRMRDIKMNVFYEGDCFSEDIYDRIRLKKEISTLKHQRNKIDSQSEYSEKFIKGYQVIQKDTMLAIFDLNNDIDEIVLDIIELKGLLKDFNQTLEHIQQKIHFTNIELSELADNFEAINTTQALLEKMVDKIEVSVNNIQNRSCQYEWEDFELDSDLTNIS